MDSKPIRDERVLEALEACRPGSDDASDPALAHLAQSLQACPELAELRDRLEQVDARLAAAFREVPVPEGLQERLIERLAAGRAPLTEPDQEPAAEPTVAGSRETAVGRRRALRNWLLAGGGAVAAASLLAAVYFGFSRTDDYDGQMVLEDAIRLFRSEASLSADKYEAGESARFPIGRFVRGTKALRYRHIRSFGGRSGVCYDMSRLGLRAALYVLSRPVGNLRNSPRRAADHTTAGCSASVWREGELMYVLVTSGNYGSFLRPPRPVA